MSLSCSECQGFLETSEVYNSRTSRIKDPLGPAMLWYRVAVARVGSLHSPIKLGVCDKMDLDQSSKQSAVVSFVAKNEHYYPCRVAWL